MVETASRQSEEDLFDETAGYDDDAGVRVASGLTEMERIQATSLYRLFNGLWGVCVVKGDPGTGKDLFGNYIQYKCKKFFPHKRQVRDERPRKLFGTYDGIFDENLIVSNLSRMLSVAKGKRNGDDTEDAWGTSKMSVARLENAADDWVKGEGELLLKNSVAYLTEFWRYCYNREPHNPMNKTMGAIHKLKRHLDILIIGTTQLTEDLDKKTCLPWIDWQVTCARSLANKTGFSYFVSRVKYDRRKNYLLPLGRAFPIRFDAGKPRSEMGDGKIVVRKPSYQPEEEVERIVLAVLNAGITNYEQLVEIIEADGDMYETEILDTLKQLSFTPRKHVIDFPCYFRLYNSKSAPQIKTSLKGEE